MANESRQDVFPVYVVDAFTDKPFSGNPAAVCLIGHEELDVLTYQQIASEMNLSDTAFIRKKSESQDYRKVCSGITKKLPNGSVIWSLRWFSPKCEVPLCGHATLASAAVLYSVLGNTNNSVTFETLSGPLNVRKNGNFFCLDMPINEPLPVEKNTVEELQSLIEATIGQLKVIDVLFSATLKILLVRLDDSIPRSDFEAFSPNIQKMLESSHGQLEVRGVIITVKGTQELGYCNKNGVPFDFVSRYFVPWLGVNEDPVTGSAHTVLASYWSATLKKSHMSARQCSSRGGDLRIRLLEGDRVEVAGPAKVALRGELKYS